MTPTILVVALIVAAICFDVYCLRQPAPGPGPPPAEVGVGAGHLRLEPLGRAGLPDLRQGRDRTGRPRPAAAGGARRARRRDRRAARPARAPGRPDGDRSGPADQALRSGHRRRRPELHGSPWHGDRVPRPERRRQDHHAARAPRPRGAHVRHGPDRRPPLPGVRPPAAPGRVAAGRDRPARGTRRLVPPARPRAEQRHRRAPGQGGAGADRARVGRRPADRGVLAWHEAAARHRGGAAGRSAGAAARRAGQRAGPGRHPLDPPAAAGDGRRGPHDRGLQPPDERDGADRRSPHRHRARQAARGHLHGGVRVQDRAGRAGPVAQGRRSSRACSPPRGGRQPGRRRARRDRHGGGRHRRPRRQAWHRRASADRRHASLEEAYLDLTGASTDFRAASQAPDVPAGRAHRARRWERPSDERRAAPGRGDRPGRVSGTRPVTARPRPRRARQRMDQAPVASLEPLDAGHRGRRDAGADRGRCGGLRGLARPAGSSRRDRTGSPPASSPTPSTWCCPSPC